VTDLLRSRGIDGVTTLLGVDGTAHGIRRRARFFARNTNVPLMIIAVGSGERIGAVLPELGGLLARPLVTLERVRICKRGGTLLTRPHPIAGRDPSGLPVWQKLMVYTSEAAAHDDTPVHVALVRALRAQGARGATSLRGIWGFQGDAAPHGDRLLGLRRRVPVVTVVIDAPERIQSVFDTVDELTAETGLVTSEVVPAAAEIAHGEQKSALSLARPRPDEPH
jgi:PII-like signaling protein